MNTAVMEKFDSDVQESAQVKYKVVDDEELRKVSRRLIEKHRKAYEALANA
ncbi:MAG: hypothetical protein IJR35_09825 [Synergistaceae bacterium]|nr:hypothetical protein [Synergistaceae bacterium]MBR0203449.1 hypothetical protein [Synergistaceae bacterium]